MRTVTFARSMIVIIAVAETLFGIRGAAADVESAAIRIHHESAGGIYAMSCAPLGDLDSDGVSDYAVSSPLANAGRVFIYSGASGAVIHELSSGSEINLFGFSVTDLGDINGDGIDDLAVGAPLDLSISNWVGSVRAFSGADGSVLWECFGDQIVESFGWNVVRVDDVNGDGTDDVAVGCPTGDRNANLTVGRVALLSGRTGQFMREWSGDIADGLAGYDITRLDDLDGDGIGDIAASSPGADRVTVLSGFSLEPLGEIIGQGNSDFGWSIASIGDFTGDGRRELLVGAPLHRINGVVRGAAFAYDTATFDLRWMLAGELTSAMGWCVSEGPDVDEDGYADALIGARDFRLSGIGRIGRLYVVSSATGAILQMINGTDQSIWFGASVGLIDDINGDGVRDVLAGREGTSQDAGAAYVLSGTFEELLWLRTEHASGIAPPELLQASADIDSDGHLDNVLLDRDGGRIGVCYSSGQHGLQPPVWIAAGAYPSDLVLADLDRDGDVDAAVTLQGQDRVVFFSNQHGLLIRSGTVKVDKEPIALTTADLDSDGYLDVVVANRKDKTVRLLEYLPHAGGPLARRYRRHASLKASLEPTNVSVARLNGGRPDIIVVSVTTGATGVFIGMNNMKFAPEVRGSLNVLNLPLTGIAFADINGDQWADAVTADGVNALVSTHVSLGDGRFRAPHAQLTCAFPPTSVVAADFDGNGRSDVAFGGNSGSIDVLWLAHGSTTRVFTQHQANASVKRMTVTDVDKDGDRDIAVNCGDGSLTLLRNQTGP